MGKYHTCDLNRTRLTPWAEFAVNRMLSDGFGWCLCDMAGEYGESCTDTEVAKWSNQFPDESAKFLNDFWEADQTFSYNLRWAMTVWVHDELYNEAVIICGELAKRMLKAKGIEDFDSGFWVEDLPNRIFWEDEPLDEAYDYAKSFADKVVREQAKDEVSRFDLVSLLNAATYDDLGKMLREEDPKAKEKYHDLVSRLFPSIPDCTISDAYEFLSDLWRDNETADQNNPDGTFRKEIC